MTGIKAADPVVELLAAEQRKECFGTALRDTVALLFYIVAARKRMAPKWDPKQHR